MKARNFTNSLVVAFIASIAMSFTACSSEGADNAFTPSLSAVVEETKKDSQEAEAPYSISVRAFSNGTDVTTSLEDCNTTLYVFDESNNFVKSVSVSTYDVQNRQRVDISAPGTESITVVAWSGLGSEEVTVLNKATIISDLQVRLKESDGFANLPNDMFYGMVKINRAQTKAGDVQQLAISRKTTNLFIRMTGVNISADDEFYFVVRQANSTVNHAGEYTGDNVSYMVQGNVTPNGKNITTDHFAVLSTALSTVELYQNGELIFSAKNLENNDKLALNAGEQVKVTFDINKTAFTSVAGQYNENIMEI